MYRIRSLFRLSVVAAAVAAGSSGAIAQIVTSTTATGSDEQLQEVVVTGSRIKVPANVSATSPITIVSSEEIKQQGHTDVTDFINQLPQAAITSSDLGNTSNPLSSANGVATVDLRGLGPQRTLVLVDGKRLGNGDPNTLNPNPAADLDQIPAALIERVDVVTGGASATYGSDAIAGVVNFIMRRNFQGIEVDGQYGFNQHNNHDTFMQNNESATGITPPTGSTTNGYRRDVSVILGTNFADGNGNITSYFSYHKQDPVNGTHYDFADCLNAGGACGNSSNSNQFNPVGGGSYSVVGNSFLPYPQAGSSPPATFNSSAYEYQQRDNARYQGGFMAHYDINEHAKPYLDFSFMDDKTTAVVAPSGLFKTSNPYTDDNTYRVNCANPFLSAQQLGIIMGTGQCAGGAADPSDFSIDIGRRSYEGGGRVGYYDHTNYRIVAGVRGDIWDGISYDAYAQYYYTTLYQANGGYVGINAAENALHVVNTANGPACVSGGSCVPWNIFNQGAVTPAQIAYLTEPGTSYGTDTEKVWHADVTADLGKFGIKLPTSKYGLAINVGWENRFEGMNYAPDQASLSGDLSGFSGAAPAISAGYTVSEGFAEARLPIAQDLPGVEDLSVDAGYRLSHYTTAGVTNTYKFEVQYAPIKDVRIRGSFDRAVRAPNLIDLFNPQSYGQQSFVGVDPCFGATPGAAPTATLEQCLRTGMTAAQYAAGSYSLQCTAGQCGQVQGGNPDLKPEVATTWSAGLSFVPSFLPNFVATIDYYHIHLVNEIGVLPGNVIFNDCLTTGNPTYCSQIVRNPVTGALHGATVAGGGYILQTSVNTGVNLVSGLDLGVSYKYDLAGWGSLGAYLNGAYTQHNTFTPYPGAPTYDCAGLFGVNCNNTINPKWRHTLRLSWETPWNFGISAFWRFIGPTTFDNNSTSPLLAGSEEGAFDPLNHHIAGYNYLDMTATAHLTSYLEVRAGVQNMFDKDPPLFSTEIVNGTQNNTFGAYDTVGRQLFVAFTAKF